MADEQEKGDEPNVYEQEMTEGLSKAMGDAAGLGGETLTKAFQAMYEHDHSASEILGLKPEQMEGVYGQAYRLFNNGQYEQAKNIFRLLACLDSMEPKYTLGIAACAHMEKRFCSAAALYYAVNTIDPQNPVPLYHKSDCHMQLGEYENAERDLKKTIALCGEKEEFSVIKDRSQMTLKTIEKIYAEEAAAAAEGDSEQAEEKAKSEKK